MLEDRIKQLEVQNFHITARGGFGKNAEPSRPMFGDNVVVAHTTELTDEDKEDEYGEEEEDGAD